MKQVGFNVQVPDLLLLGGNPPQIDDLINAVDRDHQGIQKAIQSLQKVAVYGRRAMRNKRIRRARHKRARAKGELWDESRE